MKSCPQKGLGLGKGWAQLEGSFEIEKYKKMLYTMSWRSTPGTYNVAAILFFKKILNYRRYVQYWAILVQEETGDQ
jgi:hypothetical protein